jgi:hypothetical protein
MAVLIGFTAMTSDVGGEADMATKTETVEHMTCDLCAREMKPAEAVTLYRTDNKVSAVKAAAAAIMHPQDGGQQNVDICPACHQRPVQDVLTLMYPAQG